MTVAELAAVAAEVTGVPAPKRVMPLWAAQMGVPFARLQARLTKSEPTFTTESLGALKHGEEIDCSKARKHLGHNPRPLADSIRDSYAWFEAHR